MNISVNQWVSFIDMERSDLLDMAKKKNKEIKEALDAYEVLTGDAEVKRLAELKLKSDMEEHSALLTAQKIGHIEEKQQIAIKLLKLNMNIEEIEKVTELSKDEILKLKNSM